MKKEYTKPTAAVAFLSETVMAATSIDVSTEPATEPAASKENKWSWPETSTKLWDE